VSVILQKKTQKPATSSLVEKFLTLVSQNCQKSMNVSTFDGLFCVFLEIYQKLRLSKFLNFGMFRKIQKTQNWWSIVHENVDFVIKTKVTKQK